MENPILDSRLLAQRAQIDELIKQLHTFSGEIGHQELNDTINELRNRLHEPFMFVVVGEVKAGKSSFINALLDTGREITKVAPQPMTDKVLQILYGEKEEVVAVNPFLEKIYLPVDILREIAIVDTPGTNTIIEQHQEITERFIPASDLIVFVFEAKNPYRQSAWDFLDFIQQEWRKKIIFVLQQKDLLGEEDLQVNIQGVKEQARKKEIEQPLVFAVSAKAELEGDKEHSGFAPLRKYIRENITGGQAARLKLENSLAIAATLTERLGKALEARRKQYEADQNFRREVGLILDRQTQQAERQAERLIENAVATYRQITTEKERQLARELSFFALLRRSLTGLFSKRSSLKERLEELAREMGRELENSLQNKLREGIRDLALSIQQMAELIDLKIQNSSTPLREDMDFFRDISQQRAKVLDDLQSAFRQMLERGDAFKTSELFANDKDIAPNMLTGSGIALIGAILTAVTNGAVFDITGGILTGLGLLFAGVSSSSQKRKILKGFREEVQRGRENLETRLRDQLFTYIQTVRHQIESNFSRFDAMLQAEGEELEKLEKAFGEIEGKLGELERDLK